MIKRFNSCNDSEQVVCTVYTCISTKQYSLMLANSSNALWLGR